MSPFVKKVDRSLLEMPKVHKVGMRASLAVHNAVLKGGEPTRKVADWLHGTWLGHPLHPILTDITIGAWFLGAGFDAMGALTDAPIYRTIGDRLTTVGTASALPTAVAGLADYSTAPNWAMTPATIHAVANSVGTGLYLLSVYERRRGRRGRGLLFSALGLAAATAGAWLGGRLVYRDRVGVDHADTFSEPEEWTQVLDASELGERTPQCVRVEGKKVLLYRMGRDTRHRRGLFPCGRPARGGELRRQLRAVSLARLRIRFTRRQHQAWPRDEGAASFRSSYPRWSSRIAPPERRARGDRPHHLGRR